MPTVSPQIVSRPVVAIPVPGGSDHGPIAGPDGGGSRSSAPTTPPAAPAAGEIPAAEPPGEPLRDARGLARRWTLVRQTAEAGMSTAEYAVGTVAACAFAAVLYRVGTGGSIVTRLTDLVDRAPATPS